LRIYIDVCRYINLFGSAVNQTLNAFCDALFALCSVRYSP
jgi:hypothetical protein